MGAVSSGHVSESIPVRYGDKLVIESRVVHANFLRPCRVTEVSIDRIARDDSDQDEQWIPYPMDGQARPLWMSEYFDESCRLSYIARDICHIFHANVEPDIDILERKEHFYKSLRQWESELPTKFSDTKSLAPHFVLLRFVLPGTSALNPRFELTVP